jgi:hypothetical protein
MQHHIWLTSDAKFALMIPGPLMNYLVVTCIYCYEPTFVAHTLLERMMLPNDEQCLEI